MVSISSLADGGAASLAVASACVTVSTAARLFARLVAEMTFLSWPEEVGVFWLTSS